jgi:hypothetical protein
MSHLRRFLSHLPTVSQLHQVGNCFLFLASFAGVGFTLFGLMLGLAHRDAENAKAGQTGRVGLLLNHPPGIEP